MSNGIKLTKVAYRLAVRGEKRILIVTFKQVVSGGNSINRLILSGK